MKLDPFPRTLPEAGIALCNAGALQKSSAGAVLLNYIEWIAQGVVV